MNYAIKFDILVSKKQLKFPSGVFLMKCETHAQGPLLPNRNQQLKMSLEYLGLKPKIH